MSHGNLLVNGVNAGAGTVNVNNSAILGGSGSIAGALNVNDTARIAVGASPETLATGTVTFSSGTFFDVEIGGTSPGDGTTGYDQLIVNGNVNLDNATLNLFPFGGYYPISGDSFTIIDNQGTNPVTGIFNGLAEGAMFTSGDITYSITYQGGSGNDIVMSTLYTTFVVTTVNDNGVGSLRQALVGANSNVGLDRIAFSIAGTGTQTIKPESGLPPITSPLIIDGVSQPGYAGKPIVELDGTLAGAGASGLVIEAGGAGSTIRGLAINRFNGNGVLINGSNNNIVQGNFIGTDVTGTAARGNSLIGVMVSNGSSNTLIGGSTAGAGNLISGNLQSGIYVSQAGTGNKIQGNRIGTDVSGSQAVGNASSTSIPSAGVLISSMAGNRVIVGVDGDGLQDANEGNVISGNFRSGIRIEGGNNDSGNHVIAGNKIGVNVDGTLALANQGDGILIVSSSNNRIGTNGDGLSDALEANIIGGNRNSGGNPDGTTVQATGITIWDSMVGDGLSADANTIAGNFIGTNNSGVLTLGNQAAGIRINRATGTVIGSDSAPGQNLIYFGNDDGIEIFGIGESGVSAAPSTRVLVNSFRANKGLAIDIGASGITLNDNGDTDGVLNFPVITSATTSSGNLTIRGFAPQGHFELYSASAEAGTQFGEGQTLLATFEVVSVGVASDGDGSTGVYGPVVNGVTVSLESVNENPFEFTIPLPTGVTNGSLLAARGRGSSGSNTSEFGPLVIAGVQTSRLAPVITLPTTVAPLAAGGRLQVSGSFIDLDSTLWTATVNYGDGTGERPLTLSASRTFELDFVYAVAGTYSVIVQITDNSLTTGTSPTLVVNVTNVVPVADASQFVLSTAVNEGQPASLSGPLDLLVVNKVVVDWGDGSDPQELTGFSTGSTSFLAAHFYKDDTNSANSASAEDVYQVRVTVIGPGGSDTTQAGRLPIQIRNVKPSSLVFMPSSMTLTEGSTLQLSGSFTDPGMLDTHAVRIDWGDGTIETHELAAGVTDLSQLPIEKRTHTYLDDPATGADEYIVSVSVNDDDEPDSLSAAKASRVIPVLNAAPSQVSFNLSANTIAEGGSVTIAGGAFIDPGQNDSHRVFIDWGDGSAIVTADLDARIYDLSRIPLAKRTHVYDNDPAENAPSYVISIKVTDNDAPEEFGTATNGIIVTNSAPTLSNVILDKSGPIDEGDTVQITGSLTDVGQLDRHRVNVNWGDGTSSPATVMLVTGALPTDPIRYAFTATHTFGDNFNPANIVVTAEDGRYVGSSFEADSGVATASLAIGVRNVAPKAFIAPTLDSTSTATTLLAQVTDPGFNDTFEYVWSINGVTVTSDGGSAPQRLLLDTTTFTSPPHISVTIRDDDGAVGKLLAKGRASSQSASG